MPKNPRNSIDPVTLMKGERAYESGQADQSHEIRESADPHILPFPFTVESLRQSSIELSPGAQVALDSCIGAWKVIVLAQMTLY